jgi:hypothetical protein
MESSNDANHERSPPLSATVEKRLGEYGGCECQTVYAVCPVERGKEREFIVFFLSSTGKVEKRRKLSVCKETRGF